MASKSANWFAAAARSVAETGAGLATAGLDPARRYLQHVANRASPNQLPDTSLIMELGWRGLIDAGSVSYFAALNGMSLNPGQGGQTASSIWGAVYDGMRPTPGADFYIELARQGAITEAAAKAAIQAVTGYNDWACQKLLDTGSVPDAQWAYQQHHLGKLSVAQAVAIAKANNITVPAYVTWALTWSEPHNIGDVFAMVNRGWMTADEGIRNIRASGIRDLEQAERMLKMRLFVPSPSDAIRFAVREVWNEDVVRRFGYDDAFPAAFGYWASKSGLDYDVRAAFPDAGSSGSIPWSQAFWRAHWEVPSPTQAYSMLHRLRPNRIGQWADSLPSLKPFTIQEASDLLGVADYAPGVRDWLLAISYHPLTRTDVRRMNRLGVIEGEELTESFMDLGYNRADAEKLRKFTEQETSRSKLSRGRSRVRRALDEAWKVGVLSDDEYIAQSFALTIDSQEDLEDYNVLDLDAKKTRALGDSAFAAEFAAMQATVSLGDTKRVVAAARRGYLSGTLSWEDAARILNESGITIAAQQRYIQSWQIELETRRRDLSAAQVQRLYQEGILAPEAARARLLNLGYDGESAEYLMRFNQGRVEVAQARAEAASARTSSAAERARIRELRALQRQTEQAARELLKGSTPANLAKWLKKGLIDAETVVARLEILGWTEADARLFVAEAGTSGQRPQGPQGPT